MVYLGVLVLQLASVVNDNFLGTFLSVRSFRVGSRVTLSEPLVKWVRCVPMHCNVMAHGLLLSMILTAISWPIYQVDKTPSLSPSRYKWVTFEISWFLLVNPNSLTAWLSSVCILDRLLIGGEQKPIPKYQQPRVFLGLFSHLIKQKPFSKYLWVFYASSSDNPVYLGKVFGQDSRVAFMPVQENLILEFYIDSKLFLKGASYQSWYLSWSWHKSRISKRERAEPWAYMCTLYVAIAIPTESHLNLMQTLFTLMTVWCILIFWDF